jgi:hypothetical protein
VFDDVVEFGEGLRHRQADAGQELGIDHLGDGVEHHLSDELWMNAAEIPGARAALDQPLEPGDPFS